MHVRIFVKGAAGDTANLLDVLAKAHAISDLKNNGEYFGFTVKPSEEVRRMCLDRLWAGNLAELIANTPNITCEVCDD